MVTGVSGHLLLPSAWQNLLQCHICFLWVSLNFCPKKYDIPIVSCGCEQKPSVLILLLTTRYCRDDGHRAAEDEHDAAAAERRDEELQHRARQGAGGGAARRGGQDPPGDQAAAAQQRGQRHHLRQAQPRGESRVTCLVARVITPSRSEIVEV